ncbi:hypothetical protein Q4602_00925 [Paraglaciecola chathamensis]|uniref:hypothetical protein n=1 Tax=Paraglaciecola chathamensis TaxID=368405 RepID=UPI00270AE889|nr:hypothetical protein [Paraglaciecola chathamensis]MDO6838022.1 hypothetical protein [Paraglaciecola chathamensis]
MNNFRNLDEFNLLERDINDALELIVNLNGADAAERHENNLGLMENDSLFEKCERIVKDASKAKKKPTIRILSHFACTGGTLISKCIAAQPNVYLISEAHPFSELHINSSQARYSPTDITTLSRYANVPEIHRLTAKIFKQNIDSLHSHLSDLGGTLVIREHTHVDFCLGENVSEKESVSQLLEQDYNVIKLATVRDPIDSYMSLQKNGWLHFAPQTFDEYCSRYLKFVTNFPIKNIVKYEDFTHNTKITMREICSILSIPYSENFEDYFDVLNLTGDSGRSGSEIIERSRVRIADDFRYEIESSTSYAILREKLSY